MRSAAATSAPAVRDIAGAYDVGGGAQHGYFAAYRGALPLRAQVIASMIGFRRKITHFGTGPARGALRTLSIYDAADEASPAPSSCFKPGGLAVGPPYRLVAGTLPAGGRRCLMTIDASGRISRSIAPGSDRQLDAAGDPQAGGTVRVAHGIRVDRLAT
jgi:hypothetical protein